MWAMGGGEAALLVFAAVISWVRRDIIIELVQPIKVGPIVIRFRSEQRLFGRSTLAVAEEISLSGPRQHRKKALEDVQKALSCPHHRHQNASAHRMTSAAEQKMIPSAVRATSRRFGTRAS
jgi:hypothetical protein